MPMHRRRSVPEPVGKERPQVVRPDGSGPVDTVGAAPRRPERRRPEGYSGSCRVPGPLRRRGAARGGRPPAPLDRKLRLLGPLLPRRRPAAVQAADLAAEIEWAQARLIGPRDYEPAAELAGRRPPIPGSAMADLYERYGAEKRRRGLVDFDDLLLLCADALATDAEFAAAQRWRFRHLFVDEFQDVNPAQ